MNKIRGRIRTFISIFLTLISTLLYSQEKKGGEGSEIVNITFSDFKSWQEGSEQVYLFMGRPEIRYGDTFTTADYIIAWGETKEESTKQGEQGKDMASKFNLSSLTEFYAEGTVRLKRGEVEIWGDRLFYNFKNEKGIILDFSTRTIDKKRHLPRIVKAKEAREVYKNHYLLKDASITTCNYGEPHYDVKVKNMELVVERGGSNEKSTIRKEDDATISGEGRHIYPSLLGIPLFYFPSLSFSSNDEPFLRSLKGGRSNRFGFYGYSEWGFGIRKGAIDDLGLYDNVDKKDDKDKWGDFRLILNEREKRGIEVGERFDYKGKGYFGFVDSHYFRDKGPEPSIGFDQQFLPLIDHNRGRVKVFHRQDNILKNVRGELELSYLSDRNLLPEFFEKEFKTGKEQETALYFRWLDDNIGATFLEKNRINTFMTQREYTPQLKFFAFSEPLAGGILGNIYLTSQSEASQVRQTYDRGLDIESSDAWRFDTSNDIAIPLDFKIVQLYPFVGGRFTAFQDDLDNEGRTRFIATGGVRLNKQLHKIYNLSSDTFGMSGLRHIVNMEARYTDNFYSNVGREELRQFDRIDTVDEFREISLEVRNRFQTKHNNAIVEFLNVGGGVEYYPDSDRDTTSLNNTNVLPPFDWMRLASDVDGSYEKRRFSNLFLDATFTPTKYLSVTAKEQFNTHRGDEDTRNISATITPKDDVRLTVGSSFARDIADAISFDFSLKLAEKWYFRGGESYDFKNDRTIRQTAILTREFHDFAMNMTFENHPSRDDITFMIDIVPKFMGSDKDFTKSHFK